MSVSGAGDSVANWDDGTDKRRARSMMMRSKRMRIPWFDNSEICCASINPCMPKNCWWLEKKVFYPPHLTLDKINATRDIDLSGVTKGFEKGLKIKVCLAKVLDLSRKGATCSTHEI